LRPAQRLTWLLAALPLLASTPVPDAGPGADEVVLRRGCLEATRRAVELERRRDEERLRAARGGLGPAENVRRFEERLARLGAERDRFAAMNAADYPLPSGRAEPALLASGAPGPLAPPRKQVLSIVAAEGAGEGGLLETEGQTRSGPFFHLAGIRGGDWRVLRPGRRYELDVYLVYRRDYAGFIQDHYVYVAAVRPR
jgi:hypothetical protein